VCHCSPPSLRSFQPYNFWSRFQVYQLCWTLIHKNKLVVMIQTWWQGKMHLGQIHILVRKEGVFLVCWGFFVSLMNLFFPFLSSSLGLWGDTYSCYIAAFIQVSVWDAGKDLTLISLMVTAAISLALGITAEVRVTSVFESLNCLDSSTHCYLSSQKICFVLPSFVDQYHISSLWSLNH
jgi:hypothetical protein